MSRRYRKFLVYFTILCISFFLIFVSQEKFLPIKTNISEAVSLPLRIILFPFREIKKIIFYRWAYQQAQRYKDELDLLKSRMMWQEEIILENNRFRELLDTKESLVYSSKFANVIGRLPTNWNSTILIDRGRKDGVTVGMPVITSKGIVGKIKEVSNHTSKVLLLSDPNFSVPATIQRNREGGLVTGTLEGKPRIRYLDPRADVRHGDRVITSKMSSSFPEGLWVGEVVEIYESQSSPTLECLIEPAVAFSQLEEVLIVFQ